MMNTRPLKGKFIYAETERFRIQTGGARTQAVYSCSQGSTNCWTQSIVVFNAVSNYTGSKMKWFDKKTVTNLKSHTDVVMFLMKLSSRLMNFKLAAEAKCDLPFMLTNAHKSVNQTCHSASYQR